MIQQLISYIDLYHGKIDSSTVKIDNDVLKFSILESFHKNEFYNEHYKDYLFYGSTEYDKLYPYIDDAFKAVNVKNKNKIRTLIENNRFANVYLPNEKSLSRCNLDKNDLINSPDYTLVYAVDVVDNSSTLMINYDDNKRKGMRWEFPIMNNSFFMFPSNQEYYITENNSKNLNVYLTINYNYYQY
jgi:hypothetical protein